MSRAGSERVSEPKNLSAPSPDRTDGAGPILLYDGVCGLCDRAVQFVLRHDREARFRFAALQSEFAHRVLVRHGRDPEALDTMVLVLDAGKPTERLLDRSESALAVLGELGGGWRWLAGVRIVPRPVRDWAYDYVARHRYQWFGRYDVCAVPSPEVRARFLERDATGNPDALSA